MPVAHPSDAVIPRGSLQLRVRIPPVLVSIPPPTAPTVSAGMLSAHFTGALGLDAPFAQTQRTYCDRVVPLAYFGVVVLDLKERILSDPRP